jgi:homoserine dehydrogenase
LGWLASPGGINPLILAEPGSPAGNSLTEVIPGPTNVHEWLSAARADVLFEATSLNAETGQPAISHISAALQYGAHAITANKGPVVHAYQGLTRLAEEKNRRFLFESTVMDGAPIFSMFRENMPTVEVKAFRGILNSTTNVILTGMERGLTFEESLKKAQELGIAETDATYDIDGWDAAIKVAALARVLMKVPVDLNKIERRGIRNLTAEAVRSARQAGGPYKLVCRAARNGSLLQATVRPEQVPLDDPLAHVCGTSSIVYFETDIFPGLAITENSPNIVTTAYGMFADFIRAVT